MRKTEWNGFPQWDINEEVKEAVKKTVSKMSEDELQAIRDRDSNIFEVTYGLVDLGINPSIKLEDIWDYVHVGAFEDRHFVLAVEQDELWHNDREYAEKHRNPVEFNLVEQTITVSITIVDRNKDIVDIYNDDEGYDWAVPLNSYPTIGELVRAEVNFNNGVYVLEKKKGA